MVNQPYGGKLICRELTGKKREEAIRDAEKLPSLSVNSWVLSDLELIGIGGFSPLTGFIAGLITNMLLSVHALRMAQSGVYRLHCR